MESESLYELWETLKGYIPAKDRIEAGEMFIKQCDDLGMSTEEIGELIDGDEVLEVALDRFFDEEEDDAEVANEGSAEVADEVETNRNNICQFCWHTIESERDRACILCGDLQYHSFCLRRHRNVCRDKNIPMKCGRHQNEIHRIMNMDGANIFEGDDDICLICMDSLDTKSIWGRFLCSTCPYWLLVP